MSRQRPLAGFGRGAHSRNEPIRRPGGASDPLLRRLPAPGGAPARRARRPRSGACPVSLRCSAQRKIVHPLAAGTPGVTAAAQVGGPGRSGREAAAQGAGAPPIAIGRCSREPPEAAGRPPARHHAGRAGPALQRSRLDVPAKRRPAPPMLVGLLVFSREWVSMPSVDCGMSTKL